MIYDAYFIGIYPVEFNDIAFCALAHRNNVVGVLAGFAKFVVIDETVDGAVAVGQAQEYEVVHRDDTWDAGLFMLSGSSLLSP